MMHRVYGNDVYVYTLCNACGLKYWRRQRKEGEARPYLLPDLNELPELGLDLDLNQFPQP
uniref:Uncharacterized protein n=1 Tax=Vitis vinifera TaxID=29760 RepID=F6GUE6_VITVI